MRRHGTLSSLAGLGPSDHVCWSYDDDAALRAAAVEFLADGFRHGLRGVYTAGKPLQELRADLDALDGADDLIARGALVLVPLDALYGDAIDPDRQRALAEATLHQALADGYRGLRLVAEGTPLARDPEHWPELVRWERLADDLTAGAPLSALCAYDRRELGDGAVDELLCAHPLTHRAGEQPAFRVFGHAGDVVVQGEVDLFAVRSLEHLLDHAGDGAALDLSRLRFIDHHGLEALARHGAERAAAGAPLTIRGASPAIRRAWELTLDGDAPAVAWA